MRHGPFYVILEGIQTDKVMRWHLEAAVRSAVLEQKISWITVLAITGVHLIRAPLWRSLASSLLAWACLIGTVWLKPLPIHTYAAFAVTTLVMVWAGFELGRRPQRWGRRDWSPERAVVSFGFVAILLPVLAASSHGLTMAKTAWMPFYGQALVVVGCAALFTRRAFFAWLTVLYTMVAGGSALQVDSAVAYVLTVLSLTLAAIFWVMSRSLTR